MRPSLSAPCSRPYRQGRRSPSAAMQERASSASMEVSSPVKEKEKVAAVTSLISDELALPLPPGGYCDSSSTSTRRKTRTVFIGNVPVGSDHPVATQTMATTPTEDVEATVAQIKSCADAGIDIVRITVQGGKQAKAVEHIKRRLLEDGYTVPLVADIHFTPKVALMVADHIDKVRVNPGNFADGRKSFDTLTELTEDDIEEAKAEIEKSLVPLILKLKSMNKSMRIGVNHGSLSERILFQYGDSPEGMVASAVEFAEICRKHDYHNIIFSMKSSNPRVMVQAYRALAREMYKRDWDYPLHLGVTEAGGGSDGRIKSAAGIGALLLDGIGDTIRVSLTEDPEFEAQPTAALRDAGAAAQGNGIPEFEELSARREGQLVKRKVEYPLDVPLNKDGSVLVSSSVEELKSMSVQELCARFGLRLRKDGDVQKDWQSADAVVFDEALDESLKEKIQILLEVPTGVICRDGPYVPDGATLMVDASALTEDLPQRIGGYALVFTGDESREAIKEAVDKAQPRFIILKPQSQTAVTFIGRRFMSHLIALECEAPVMFWFRYPKVAGETEDDVIIKASADYGSLFIDGYGEGVLWDVEGLDTRESTFNLLQACRMRISKTEFISCPSCGRTLFDLQTTTKRIEDRTGHLPGVRIAVMGCIVNGPGEMADADFGYVGSVPGKVDLYVNYDKVKVGIPSDDAVDALVDLIKEHGKWQDPPSEEEDEE